MTKKNNNKNKYEEILLHLSPNTVLQLEGSFTAAVDIKYRKVGSRSYDFCFLVVFFSAEQIEENCIECVERRRSSCSFSKDCIYCSR